MSDWKEVTVKFKNNNWRNVKKGEIRKGFISLDPPDDCGGRTWVELEDGADPANTDLKNFYSKLYGYLVKNNIKVHSFLPREVDIIDMKEDEYELQELRCEI